MTRTSRSPDSPDDEADVQSTSNSSCYQYLAGLGRDDIPAEQLSSPSYPSMPLAYRSRGLALSISRACAKYKGPTKQIANRHSLDSMILERYQTILYSVSLPAW